MFKPSLTKLNEIYKYQKPATPTRDLSLTIDITNDQNQSTNDEIRNSHSSSSSISNNNNQKYLNVTLVKGPTGFGIAISENRQNKLIIRGINFNGVAYQVKQISLSLSLSLIIP